jgi:hypothetical protein
MATLQTGTDACAPAHLTLSILPSSKKERKKLQEPFQLGRLREKECGQVRSLDAWRIDPGSRTLKDLARPKVADMAHGGVAYIWTVAAQS